MGMPVFRASRISFKKVVVPALGLGLLVFVLCVAECQGQATLQNSNAVPTPGLDAVAARLSILAKKAGCGRVDCKILVVDCNTMSGFTSCFGIQFSDELSEALARLESPDHIVARSILRTFLEDERIPSNLLLEPTATRWLGKKLGAATVILPALSYARGAQVFFKLLSVESGKIVEAGDLEVTVPTPSLEDLNAFEVFGPVAARSKTSRGELLEKLDGKNPKMKLPSCFYAPAPPYSGSALGIHFGGIVLIEAIISKTGAIEDTRGHSWSSLRSE